MRVTNRQNMVSSIATIDGVPVYRVLLDDDRDGMVRVSLVDDPAVMSDFVAFGRQEPQRFAVQDEDKRLVFGVVARADFPVFRTDPVLGDHYVIFPADTIREMAQKYLTENRANRVDLMHDGDDVDDVPLVQWFIKDTAKGIAPAGFDDIADGSLFAEYHVEDDEIWQQVKDGTYKGFSMEVFYTLTPESDTAAVAETVADLDGMFERIIAALTSKHNMNKKNLLRKLGRMLAEFATVTTDKGVLAWDGDEDLKAGDRVYIEDADGERTEAADGDYKTEDGKIIVVADGAVAEIRDPEAEVAPAAEDDAEDLAAQQQTAEPAALSRHNRIRAIFEESFEDKEKAIYKALSAIGLEYPWLVEAGDTYAVVCVYGSEGEKYYRYELSFNEDGECVLGDFTEVEPAFVPAEGEGGDPAPAVDVEEFERIKAENEQLKAQVAKLSRAPLADPAKKGVKETAPAKTGVRGIDKLSRYLKN